MFCVRGQESIASVRNNVDSCTFCKDLQVADFQFATDRRGKRKSPRAMWRFYGYYGGFSVLGNMRTYGQYADDSTFELVPVWQNKLQAMAYEAAIWTRTSHYSYEIKNNQQLGKRNLWS